MDVDFSDEERGEQAREPDPSDGRLTTSLPPSLPRCMLSPVHLSQTPMSSDEDEASTSVVQQLQQVLQALPDATQMTMR